MSLLCVSRLFVGRIDGASACTARLWRAASDHSDAERNVLALALAGTDL